MRRTFAPKPASRAPRAQRKFRAAGAPCALPPERQAPRRLRFALSALAFAFGLLSSCTNFIRPESIPSNRYALLVGVRDYQSQSINDLTNPDKDVADMAALLAQRGWSVQTLVNSQATYEAVEGAVAGLSADDSATILVYFSGHGHVMDGNTYILPYDFRYGSYYDSSTYVNGITPSQLSSWLGAVPARHRLLILDSCYSGGFSQGEGFVDMSPGDYSA
ncbi:MAG TPA: caspase family protein, partial [Rectinemataceae bacterium]